MATDPVAIMSEFKNAAAGPTWAQQQQAQAQLADTASQTAQRNAIAEQNKAKAAIEQAQVERDKQDAEIERKAWSDSLDENGNFDPNKFSKGMGQASPARAFGALKYVAEYQKAAKDKDTAQRAAEAAGNARIADIADSVTGAPAGQELERSALGFQTAVREGHLLPNEVPDLQTPEDVKHWWDLHGSVARSHKSMLDNSKVQAEIDKEKQALIDAKAKESREAALAPGALTLQGTDIATKEADLADKQRKADATVLEAAFNQGPEAYAAALDEMPVKRAKAFLGAKTVQEVRNGAMTADERTKADQAAAIAKETAQREADKTDEPRLARQVVIGQQPGATPEQIQAGKIADATLKRINADKILVHPPSEAAQAKLATGNAIRQAYSENGQDWNAVLSAVRSGKYAAYGSDIADHAEKMLKLPAAEQRRVETADATTDQVNRAIQAIEEVQKTHPDLVGSVAEHPWNAGKRKFETWAGTEPAIVGAADTALTSAAALQPGQHNFRSMQALTEFQKSLGIDPRTGKPDGSRAWLINPEKAKAALREVSDFNQRLKADVLKTAGHSPAPAAPKDPLGIR